MSAADQRNIDGLQFEKVSVTHWRAVSEEGGIAYETSSREQTPGIWPADLRRRVEVWCEQFPSYHLETWEQTWWVSEAEWKKLS